MTLWHWFVQNVYAKKVCVTMHIAMHNHARLHDAQALALNVCECLHIGCYRQTNLRMPAACKRRVSACEPIAAIRVCTNHDVSFHLEPWHKVALLPSSATAQ